MKRAALLLALLTSPLQAAVLVSSGTLCTQMTAPAGSVVLVDIFTAEVIGSTPTAVVCPACPACPACTTAPVGVSTGPVVMQASDGGCYRVPRISPNGTFATKPEYVNPCPK